MPDVSANALPSGIKSPPSQPFYSAGCCPPLVEAPSVPPPAAPELVVLDGAEPLPLVLPDWVWVLL